MTTKAESRTAKLSSVTVELSDESLLSSFDPILEVSPSIGSLNLSDEVAEAMVERFDLTSELERIPQKVYFRIGEVADLLRVKPYVLRFWETEFPMLAPKKGKTGQRVFQRREVELLFLVKHLLYVERFSIEGARKRLKEMKRAGELKKIAGTPVAAGISPPISVNSARRMAAPLSSNELRVIVEDLKDLASLPASEFFRYSAAE